MATSTQRAQAIELLNNGYSYDSVAGFFGVKAATVQGWADPAFAASQKKKFKDRNFRRKKGWLNTPNQSN